MTRDMDLVRTLLLGMALDFLPAVKCSVMG